MTSGSKGPDISVEVDPCSRAALARHPDLEGRTSNPALSGVRGLHCGEGPGVTGVSIAGNGVVGDGARVGVMGQTEEGTGVFGKSKFGEGIHGETRSPRFAAVAGFAISATRSEDGFPTGVWGSSRVGEGVHGETSSDIFAAVAGIQLNESSSGAGIYGEHRGDGPAGFFNGNVVVTKDIFLSNADCAEEFPAEAAESIEAGTVMVIDANGGLERSQRPYDKKVAGIVSGAGSFRPAIILDKQPGVKSRLSIALIGKVFCKVDASFGAIEIGDLLTTSANPGHAMKASDSNQAFGAVLGKALQPLQHGTGLIAVLVTLQ